MKKSTKRILCGALSLALCSTFAVEGILRLGAEGHKAATTTATAETSFKDVTGKFDTSKVRESYFNDSVLKSEDVAPVYETRTVMITLSGDCMVTRADGASLDEYTASFSGERAKSEINKEQSAFLQALSKKGIAYKIEHTYNTVLNAVAVELDTKYVSEIKKMDGVESVVITTAYEESKTVESLATNSDVVLNETDVYETGIYDSSAFAAKYGEGTVVAVLDTGLDYTHRAFQGFQSENVDYAWDRDYIKSVLKNKDLASEVRSGSLDAAQVYVSEKVPYAYDYADDDPDVYPSYSNHGTHVAGIIGGYDPTGYTDKDGNPITDKEFLGVVPDAQLVICKVFTDDLDDPDLGGAVSEDIVAALEDCVKLGVDVINMSLGSSCGFTTTNDGDDEGDMLNEVYTSIANSGISLICAASNDFSAGYGGVYGTNLASNPDAGTVGSPSTYPAALSVASINGQKASYLLGNPDTENQAYVFFEESRDINSNPFDFVGELEKNTGKKEFEYVVVPGVGRTTDYTSAVIDLLKDENGHSRGRVALVKRGDTTFEDKVRVAIDMGAIGVIVYNNVAGMIRMNLGEIENPIPAVSINMNAGTALVNGATDRIGKFTIDRSYAAGPFMSDFSSWGPTPDLKLKPEITAHGGEITSAVPGGYGEQSGTSMATPNMAGFMAIVRSYIKQDLGVKDAKEINRLAMQLTMSTAGTVYDQDGLPYSPRKQGAGVAKLENVVGGSKAYLWTDVKENDYRPKVELGDDPKKTGVYTLNFKISNFGTQTLSFKPEHEFMTETLSSDRLTVSEQAHLLSSSTAAWKVDGQAIAETDTISVEAGKTRSLTVVLTLGDADREYIETSFENGMYVEGFAKLISSTDGQCDLTLPFLGFYGDWDAAPMLDYSAYEVAANAQDSAILEEDKIKASIWATQPYNIYYNEKYILPMGGYLYLLPDDAEPMYVDEEHNSVSRYNEYYGEGEVNNYMTTTGIKAVYAGLLRNARVVKYQLIDESTGEVLVSDSINRVAKAYSGGGSARPANVEFELFPEDEGLIANGKYKMTFEFFKDTPAAGQKAKEDDTFEFSFTVDYDAPVLEDARVRFYNYKEGNKDKQRVYLDVDVYDNHYAQTLMICYPKTSDDGDVSLQIATEYPTPIRDAVRNGITTVSVEITDIYEKYGDQLYIQLDDYALNTCLYQVNINKANANMTPDGDNFSLAEGESEVSLDIYETHKSELVFGDAYVGEGDASNFLWTSANPKVADVKNGEIVGLSAGTTKIFVNNRKGTTKTINVTVSDTVSDDLPDVPSISFGVIKTDKEALQKAEGRVNVSAGASIKMSIEKDPWYHPMTDLKVVWSTSKPEVATVDQEGNVLTLKKGTAIISATVMQMNEAGEWEETLYTATSTLRVQNEFTVSEYTLTDYNGVGGTVVIPTDLNIMYIGAEAFKENNNIKKIIIPSSVVDIRERAFINCTALEEVYFVSEEKQAIADADVSMIYEQAFYGCTNLKKVDFSNVKTVTVAADCFGGCPNLSEVVDMPSIGTMHHRAFAGSALKSVDLTGLHMSGDSVFEGCQELTTIQTGKFTAIGNNMFRNCLNLRNEITLHTPKIGESAFADCVNLAGVKFRSPEGTKLEFDIGARAFENCGKNTKGNFTVDFGTEIIRSIGTRAFAGSTLKNFGQIYGLEVLGENVFANTQVSVIQLTDDLDVANLRVTGVPFDGLTLTVASSATKYAEENGVIYSADKSTIFYVNSSVTGEMTIPATVTTIGDYAFAGSNVSKVILTANVSSIGVGAFKGAKLTAIDFANSPVTSIPASAFENSTLKQVELSNRVTEIGEYAFANSALSSVKGMGLRTVQNNAFEGCAALTKVELSNGVKEMGDYVFYNCISLEEITLPSVEKLGEYTFLGADKLNKVVFGANAKTTGAYTFARTPITSVTFANGIKTIGEGLFYECDKLASVTLPDSAVTVEKAAFYDCKALAEVQGISHIQNFGDHSFYNVALKSLNLAEAKKIDYMAFATFEDETEKKGNPSVCTEIVMPVVEEIGDFAFFNSGVSSISLPKTLKTVGAAAFASSDNLASISVDENNETLFIDGNVLYRYTDKANEKYELLCYPTALVQEGEKGARNYSIKEGTVRIQAYAFYHLNQDDVNTVVLPYSVNAIGDSAFFESGIKEYTFESIKAPALETSYRAEVREVIASQTTIAEYKGYFNNNFDTYLYFFTQYGGQTSKLVMNYPCNGTGYDNPIYKIYFGTRNASAAPLMEDETRECIKIVTEMPSPEEIATWKNWSKTEENKQKVLALAEAMKKARVYYNNAMEDPGQKVFISAEIETKLLAAEKALREVKIAFGIPFVIIEVRVAEDSQHKSQYRAGEKFDMSGLSLLVVYDDYSTEKADPSKYVLVTTEALRKENTFVDVTYEGVTVGIQVTVTGEFDESLANKKDPVNWKPIVIAASVAVGIAAIVCLAVILFGNCNAKKQAQAAAKAKEVKDFEEKYGEIHVNVYAVVSPEDKPKEGEEPQESNLSQVKKIVKKYGNPSVKVPEGGKVVTKVKIKKKSEPKNQEKK